MFVQLVRLRSEADLRKVTYDLPDPEFMEELRLLNWTPKEVLDQTDLMQLTMPMLRADSQACQTYEYVYEPPLNCPMTVIGGLNDKIITRSELEGWRQQTTSACTVRMLPGDHLFVNTAPTSILRMVVDELSLYPH
jgi:medium-chain acyl-[acyl-carrier-protein] hydrolase